jgi:drug/metabolite transporter (DMT)-like permease
VTSDNLRGSALMIFAMALFAVEDLFLKWAAADLPVAEILFATGLAGGLFFLLIHWAQGGRLFGPGAAHPALWWRNAGEMAGTLAYLTALALVPLALVAAVLQALPLAATLGAALFLGEKVGWRRWAAMAVGLLGVLIVIRPGFEGFRPEVLWVLLTVAALALRDLSARRIPAFVSHRMISAWGLLAVAFLGGGLGLFQGGWRWPEGWAALSLTAAIGFGTIGYWAITAASRTGDVGLVAPFRYTRLLFALVIAVLVLGETPDAATLGGSGLIIAAGLYSFLRERRRAAFSRAAVSDKRA